MAKPKTVHTEAISQPVDTLQITFPSVEIAEFGRIAPTKGWIKFRCGLNPKSMEDLFAQMKWDIPGDRSSLERLDGKLEGGHFILTPKVDKEQLKLKSKDGKVDTEFEINIEFDEISGFECHRLELKGRKNKGKRRELRFSTSYHCEDGAANLEAYMMRTDNATGSLKVTYLKEAEQQTLVPDGVTASPEQQQAALGIQ